MATATLPLLFAHCTRSAPRPEHDVSLYSGLRDIVTLGDSETQVLQRARGAPERMQISNDPGLLKLRFSHLFNFRENGTRVYFRHGRVALIAAQEPFRGKVQGKRLTLFKFGPPPENTWEEVLTRELGEPLARASGGRFGSEAFFYPWGDISYNRMGPNEIALYRDPDVSRYRLKNFGREVKFFKSKP